MKLLKYKWYRGLFSNRTFVKCDGVWIDYKNYTKGKITNVDGKWNTLAWCSCGNELTRSCSYKCTHDNCWEYECTNCKKKQYWSPNYIPGLLPCDATGKPL